jgi:4-amino-4-deoxy-L-arabinose transferase-like glycosyltransferase
MRRLVRDPVSWMVLAWVGAGLLWLRLNRWNHFFELDESGYLSMVVRVGDAGWADRWTILTGEGNHGPLQAILALPAQILITTDPRVVLVENLVLAAATAVVVCVTVRRLATRTAGTVAAAIVLLAPGVIEHSRTALTSTPSMFFAALALHFLVRGSGLERTGWAAATGVAIGAMTLARSMTVGLLPAVAVVGLGWAVLRRTPLPVVARNGAVTVATALLTAGWWWVLRWSDVGTYVFGGGSDDTEQFRDPVTKSGVHTAEIVLYLGVLGVIAGLFAALVLLPRGPGRSRRSRTVDIAVAAGSLLALLVGLGAALAAADDPFAPAVVRLLLWPVLPVVVLALAVRRVRRADASEATVPVETDLSTWPIWAGVATGLVVLATSTVYGVGFALPLVPWVAVAGVTTIARRLDGRRWTWWWAPVLAVSAVAAVLVPGPGMETRLVWCVGDAPKAFCDVSSTAEGTQWEETNDRIAARLARIADHHVGDAEPRVAMTGRGFAINGNTVGLSLDLHGGPALALGEYLQGADPVEAELAAVVADAEVVVVLPDRFDHVILTEGSPSPDEVVAAVQGAGFVTCDEIPVPDGRTVTIYVAPSVPAAACAP